MSEAELRFQREQLEGVVAVGTYLEDAAKRLGIRFDAECDPAADIHFCSMVIASGGDFLSKDTRAEKRFFRSNDRATGERLACQARIERGGEIVIMTKEKPAEESTGDESVEDKDERYVKEFAELPLEKQIANLVRLETIALGQTVSFIINSPFKVGEKLMDVMAEFGLRKEERQKEAARPEEHRTGNGEGESVVDAVEKSSGSGAA